MTELIVSGVARIAPTLVLGYESARAGGSIVHDVLGDQGPDVTLRPAGLRTGRLELLFDDPDDPAAAEAAAAAAEQLHTTPAVFTLLSDDRPSLEMSYVIADGGSIDRQLEDATREAWIVSFDFHEVRA